MQSIDKEPVTIESIIEAVKSYQPKANIRLTFQMAGRGCVNYKVKDSRPLYDVCTLLETYLEVLKPTEAETQKK